MKVSCTVLKTSLRGDSQAEFNQRRLKLKQRGSNNWLKLQKKIGRLHEKVANTRKDWHYRLAHSLCDRADNIFVEDINFKSWSRGIVCKQSLDSGIGGFINQILPYTAWKRGKYYAKVDKNYTSQDCPECAHRVKKSLSTRTHVCECGYVEDRDIASAIRILQIGLSTQGHWGTYGSPAQGTVGTLQEICPLGRLGQPCHLTASR